MARSGRVNTQPGAIEAHGADWVWCPLEGLFRKAWVLCLDGAVLGIADAPPRGARIFEHGPGMILPGLVNAHTHLELSFLAGKVPPAGDFVDWVRRLVNVRPGHDPVQAAEQALSGALACRDHGAALVGDITNTGRACEAWLQAGVSSVSFFEALGPSRGEPETESVTWRDGMLQAKAIAAHAPYSIPAWRMRELKARAQKLPISIHLAESRAEMELFAGDGAEGLRLQAFLKDRGFDTASLDMSADRPLQHLINLGMVDERTLLVHGVQLNAAEARELAARGASLCVCPRSNLGLCGQIANLEQMLEAGVNLCLGTDSLASAPDLSIWRELKTLREHAPGLSAEALLRMATLNGARALGFGEDFGSLQKGTRAVLAFSPLRETSPRLVLEAAIEAAGARLAL